MIDSATIATSTPAPLNYMIYHTANLSDRQQMAAPSLLIMSLKSALDGTTAVANFPYYSVDGATIVANFTYNSADDATDACFHNYRVDGAYTVISITTR